LNKNKTAEQEIPADDFQLAHGCLLYRRSLRSWINHLRNPEETTVNGTEKLVFAVPGKESAFL